MRAYSSVPQMLVESVGCHADSLVLHAKRDGQWDSLPAEAMLARITALACGLQSSGLQPGQSVGLLARSSPSWIIADLAIIVAGCVSVPFFLTFPEKVFKYKVTDSGMKTILVFGAECWEAMKPFASMFDLVVTSGVEARGANIIDIEELVKRGMDETSRAPDWLERRCESVDENDLAIIIYTSGSTGIPKGVELTHRNLISQVKGALERVPLDPKKDTALTCLPLAHSFEHMILYYYIAGGVSVYFADDIKNMGDCLREVRPTSLTVVPRILEKVYARMQARVHEADGIGGNLKRWAFARANHPHPDSIKPTNWLDRLADVLVHSGLNTATGGHLKQVVVGGAKMPITLHQFFVDVGLPLFEGYGLTESAPVLCTNYSGHRKIGSVGQAFPGVKLDITAEGEVIASGPNIMLGYHNKPEETARMIDADGWLHTGDLGELDEDGYLTITGRIKELCKTSTGKYVSPGAIEQALTRSSLVSTAMVIAEGRPFVSCLLFPDVDLLSQAKARAGLSELDDEAFLRSLVVTQAVDALLEAVNRDLEEWEKVRRYRFIAATLSTETGELTPTMKLRRHVVLEKYADVVEAIYATRPDVPGQEIARESPGAAQRAGTK